MQPQGIKLFFLVNQNNLNTFIFLVTIYHEFQVFVCICKNLYLWDSCGNASFYQNMHSYWVSFISKVSLIQARKTTPMTLKYYIPTSVVIYCMMLQVLFCRLKQLHWILSRSFSISSILIITMYHSIQYKKKYMMF